MKLLCVELKKKTFKLLSLTCEVDVVHLGLVAVVAAEAAPPSSIGRLLRVTEVGGGLQQRRNNLVVGRRIWREQGRIELHAD